MDLFDKEMINQIVQLRKLRNVLIHDIELPDQAQIPVSYTHLDVYKRQQSMSVRNHPPTPTGLVF